MPKELRSWKVAASAIVLFLIAIYLSLVVVFLLFYINDILSVLCIVWKSENVNP